MEARSYRTFATMKNKFNLILECAVYASESERDSPRRRGRERDFVYKSTGAFRETRAASGSTGDELRGKGMCAKTLAILIFHFLGLGHCIRRRSISSVRAARKKKPPTPTLVPSSAPWFPFSSSLPSPSPLLRSLCTGHYFVVTLL